MRQQNAGWGNYRGQHHQHLSARGRHRAAARQAKAKEESWDYQLIRCRKRALTDLATPVVPTTVAALPAMLAICQPAWRFTAQECPRPQHFPQFTISPIIHIMSSNAFRAVPESRAGHPGAQAPGPCVVTPTRRPPRASRPSARTIERAGRRFARGVPAHTCPCGPPGPAPDTRRPAADLRDPERRMRRRHAGSCSVRRIRKLRRFARLAHARSRWPGIRCAADRPRCPAHSSGRPHHRHG